MIEIVHMHKTQFSITIEESNGTQAIMLNTIRTIILLSGATEVLELSPH